MSSASSNKGGSKINSDDPRLSELTVHGKPLVKSGKESRTKGRERSHSLRRLDRETLQNIATSGHEVAGGLATEEIQTRQAMRETSVRQSGNRWTKAMSDKGIDALRYGASLAEEAVDHLWGKLAGIEPHESVSHLNPPKQLGYTEQHGRGGLGFSGGEAEGEASAKAVMGKMIELNQQQQQITARKRELGTPMFEHSTTFEAVRVPRVIPEVTDISTTENPTAKRSRVCAAHRSAVTANFAGKSGEIPTHDIPTRGATMEVASNAYGGSDRKQLKEFVATTGNTSHPAIPIDLSSTPRARANSVNNIMNSCTGCSQERVARARSGSLDPLK